MMAPLGTSICGELTSFRYDRDLRVRFEGLPDGIYAAFATIFEDNNSEVLTFAAEGRVVQRRYASGGAGHWQRLGPWITAVNDESLELTSQGGAVNLSGIELWKMIPHRHGIEVICAISMH